MERNSLKLSGFCHSCSSLRPLDKMRLSQRPLQPSDAKTSEVESFHNLDELTEIASGNYIADNNFKYAWETKKPPVSPTFVEWKTMETSMEDGLLGRAAVSRTSTEHTPWEMPRTLADSSDNFSQYDSFNYGSRQDYRRRLRKASMIKELEAVTSMKCPAPEFFEGISSVVFPRNRNRRDWDGDLFDHDRTSIQVSAENRETEEFASEGTDDSDIVALGFRRSLKPMQEETSNLVVFSCLERSNTDDLLKICTKSTNILPCQTNEAERINYGTPAEEHCRNQRRFPPSLPSLRKTSSLLPHRVPLQLLQPIRSKGRLLIKEVQVTSQMVFQPIRRDGRLQLRLLRNGNKTIERYNSSSESAHIGFKTKQMRPNREMDSPIIVTDAGDDGEQSSQTDQNEAIVSLPMAAGISAKCLFTEETECLQATAKEPMEQSALAETESEVRVSKSSEFQKLGRGHIGVLQTMQQILFQTIQYHYDQECQNELIRSFAARALKLTLCRAAFKSAEKKSSADTNPPDIISKRRADSIDVECVKSYEASFNSELDPNDSNSKLFQMSHMLDAQDPSMQHCRYKGNSRQPDEGLTGLWEAHCIAT